MLAIEICKDNYTVYKTANIISAVPTNGKFKRVNDAFVFQRCEAAADKSLSKTEIAKECATYLDQVVVDVTNEIVF